MTAAGRAFGRPVARVSQQSESGLPRDGCLWSHYYSRSLDRVLDSIHSLYGHGGQPRSKSSLDFHPTPAITPKVVAITRPGVRAPLAASATPARQVVIAP